MMIWKKNLTIWASLTRNKAFLPRCYRFGPTGRLFIQTSQICVPTSLKAHHPQVLGFCHALLSTICNHIENTTSRNIPYQAINYI